MKPSLFLFFLSVLVASARPNIVYILTDDLGYGDLSCYGQAHFETPVLDGLAERGLRFTDHYSGATVCAPARCSLMTGRDPGHAWIRGNGPFALRPDPEDLTVATLLQRAGYHTALIGKSTVTGNTQTPETALQKGFDVFYGTTDHRDGHFRYPEFIYDQTEKVVLEDNHLHHGEHYDAELYTRKAEQFIAGQSAENPFFLLLSYPIPHASNIAPEGVAERLDIENDIDFSESNHYSTVDNVKANYAGMVVAIDTYVGRVMAALEARDLAEDTLVIFTSDNGSHYEGGYHPDLLDSNSPFRGGKRDLYEGGIRVPMIAHWPGGILQPGTPSHPCAFWDFLPTACDLAGIKAPSGIEGVSFAPTILGNPEAQAAPEFLYWEFHEKRSRRALRQGDWKLVQYDLSAEPAGTPRLYDLSKDLGEQNDLAAKHPDMVEEMVERMNRHRQPAPLFPNRALDELSK